MEGDGNGVSAALQRHRSSLFEPAPYLKPYVIRTPTKEWKIYGQTHIIHHHLHSSIPLAEYVRSPYITVSLDKEVGKGFVWFWYAVNDLTGPPEDSYWKGMTLSERLDVWPYIKNRLPNIYRWYYENLFASLFREGNTELIPVLNDIVNTMPVMVPLNNRVSLFDIAYRRITGLPFPSMRDLKEQEGMWAVVSDSSWTRIIELDDGSIHVYRVITSIDHEHSDELVPFDLVEELGIDEFRTEGLSKRLFSGEKDLDEHDIDVIIVNDMNGNNHYLYDRSNDSMIRISSETTYIGHLHKTNEMKCEPSSRDYIDSIYSPIRVGDLTLHGDLLTMRKRSPFIRSIDKFDESVTLLPWKLDLLLPIWEWMNGRSGRCAIPVLESFTVMNYFQIPFDTSFMEQYISDLLLHSRKGWNKELYLQLLGIINSIPKAALSKYRVMEEQVGDNPRSGVVHLYQGSDVIEMFSEEEAVQKMTLADKILAQIHVPSSKLFSSPYKDFVEVTDGVFDAYRDILVIWYLEGISPTLFPIVMMGNTLTGHRKEGISKLETHPLKVTFNGRWLAHKRNEHVSSVITVMRRSKIKGFEYKKKGISLDDEKKYVRGVVFDRINKLYGRQGRIKLDLPRLSTELEAVRAAEEYLSQPITAEYVVENVNTQVRVHRDLEGLQRGVLLGKHARIQSIFVLPDGVLQITQK